MPDIKIGNIIKCTVTGIETYGIFVSTKEDYTGLIHISEISNKFVKNVSDYAKVGESIYAKVIGIDNNKLKLSIKNIDYNNTGEDLEQKISFDSLKKQLPIWINEYKKSKKD